MITESATVTKDLMGRGTVTTKSATDTKLMIYSSVNCYRRHTVRAEKDQREFVNSWS